MELRNMQILHRLVHSLFFSQDECASSDIVKVGRLEIVPEYQISQAVVSL